MSSVAAVASNAGSVASKVLGYTREQLTDEPNRTYTKGENRGDGAMQTVPALFGAVCPGALLGFVAAGVFHDSVSARSTRSWMYGTAMAQCAAWFTAAAQFGAGSDNALHTGAAYALAVAVPSLVVAGTKLLTGKRLGLV